MSTSTSTTGIKANPHYDYYLVLDFEATCCDNHNSSNVIQESTPKFQRRDMEIIEFPSVLLDVRPMRTGNPPIVVSEYQAYVKPRINPTLTAFCTDLTGITQDTVDAANSFAHAYRGHMMWLQELGFKFDTICDQMCIVTCGNWDLRTMLPRQLLRHELTLDNIRYPYPEFYKWWVNIQTPFQEVYQTRGGMARMLDVMGIELTGRHHSGIDDCRNTAKIVIRLLEKGAPLYPTSTSFRRDLERSVAKSMKRYLLTETILEMNEFTKSKVCKFDGECYINNPKHWKRKRHLKQDKPVEKP